MNILLHAKILTSSPKYFTWTISDFCNRSENYVTKTLQFSRKLELRYKNVTILKKTTTTLFENNGGFRFFDNLIVKLDFRFVHLDG